MTAQHLVQILLRLLPALAVFGLAFWAASDGRTRQRWADLLYQTGTIKPAQRSDERVQRGVRIPFFVVALGLLWWPISFYLRSTRVIEAKSDLYTRPATPSLYKAQEDAALSGTPVPGAVAPAGATPLPGQPTPVPTPTPRLNIYGTPLP